MHACAWSERRWELQLLQNCWPTCVVASGHVKTLSSTCSSESIANDACLLGGARHGCSRSAYSSCRTSHLAMTKLVLWSLDRARVCHILFLPSVKFIPSKSIWNMEPSWTFWRCMPKLHRKPCILLLLSNILQWIVISTSASDSCQPASLQNLWSVTDALTWMDNNRQCCEHPDYLMHIFD